MVIKSEETKQALETKVSRFASLTPRLITVKLTKLAEYDMRGEVLSIGQKATVTPAPRNVAADARLLQRNAFADVKEAADFASFMTYGDYRPAQVVTNAVAVANGTLRIRTNHTVVTAKTFDPLAAPDQRLVVKFTIKSWTGKQLGDPVEFSVVLANRDRMDQAEKAGRHSACFWVLRSSGAWHNGSYLKACAGLWRARQIEWRAGASGRHGRTSYRDSRQLRVRPHLARGRSDDRTHQQQWRQRSAAGRRILRYGGCWDFGLLCHRAVNCHGSCGSSWALEGARIETASFRHVVPEERPRVAPRPLRHLVLRDYGGHNSPFGSEVLG